MKLVGGSVLVIIAVMIGIQLMPMLMGSLGNLQEDPGTASKNSITGVGETTDTILFTDPLFEDNIAYVSSITSDNGGDTPAAASYTAATDTLNISGLAASGTRVLSIAYTADGLDGYTGMSDMVKLAAFIIFIALLGAAIYSLFPKKA